MRRLLKISFDQALLSLTPILSWFCLSIILDPNLINVFTITYPLQFLYYTICAPFATGANISKIRDHNPHAVMSGLLIGLVLTISIYGFIAFNVDSYISFMHMDVGLYRDFTLYSIFILIYQTIFTFVLEKLYYENRNSTANHYSIAFNLLSFGLINSLVFFTKTPSLSILISLIVLGIFIAFIVCKNIHKFRFRLNIFHCIKYESVTLASSLMMCLIYLFGFSGAAEYGPQYTLAIAFVALITDTQWDVLDSVNTLAKIDISQKHFNFKTSLRHAYCLLGILFATITAMFLCLYWFYQLDLTLTLIYLGFEIVTFLIDPFATLYNAYLQLNWSASRTTGIRITTRALRFGLTMIPSPFCTSIGMLGSAVCQVATVKYCFNKNFSVSTKGRVSKRRSRRKLSTRYRYDDIVINKLPRSKLSA